MPTIISGKDVADKLKQEIAAEVTQLKESL